MAEGGNYEPLNVLTSFGLSGYQARVYLALLELGPSQAREVSDRSGVPQGRVYDVLEKLHQRGLAEVLPEAPRRYRAVAFELFLERELKMHRERVATLERERAPLLEAMASAQGQVPAAERGEYLVLRGRKPLLERVGAVAASANRDVLALGTEKSAQRFRRAASAALADASSQGVRQRLLVPVDASNAPAVRECLELGVEVRHHGGLRESLPAGLSVLVADGERLILAQHLPDDLDPVKGDDAGLLIEHPQMVRGLGALAETLWALGVPAADRLEELASRGPAPPAETVLLVDDEPDILHSLQELLRGAMPEVRVRTADTGPAAVRALQEGPVDLIITDYKLPGLSGLEVLAEAGKLAPGVPRILITAFPDLRVALRAINEAGVEHFLTKPFQPRQFLDVVRSALARRAEERVRNRMLAMAVDPAPPAPAPPGSGRS